MLNVLLLLVLKAICHSWECVVVVVYVVVQAT